MTALSTDFRRAAAQLGEEVTRPYPNSRKVYLQGSRPDLQVPLREISQYPTPTELGAEENPPIPVYDCSGPYTDPNAAIDLLKGLPPVRAAWIEERGDTEILTGLSSEYGRARAIDPKTANLRFEHIRVPRRGFFTTTGGDAQDSRWAFAPLLPLLALPADSSDLRRQQLGAQLKAGRSMFMRVLQLDSGLKKASTAGGLLVAALLIASLPASSGEP